VKITFKESFTKLRDTIARERRLGETEQEDLFKDPDMLKRLNEIEKMDKEDKNHILYAIDAFIKSVKLKNIAAL